MSPAAGAAYVKAPTADQCDWQVKGLCSSGLYESEMWDSRLEDESMVVKHRRELKAKAVCQHCPVQTTCAKWALEHGEQHGTWGGLTESERRSLLMGRPPRGAASSQWLSRQSDPAWG